jgi:hypothetical protein
MRYLSASLLLVVPALFAGCERDSGREPALTPASRTRSGAERAAEEITKARCDREARCDNIGRDDDYTSNDDCMRSLYTDSYDQLDDCDSGVDRFELRECLAEIGEDDCDALGRLDSYVACNLDDLCLD